MNPNLLISEPPLQVLPSLAMQVGLNEAILLQQLHFRSLISNKEKDGHKWVVRTYPDWKEKEFPFWSVDTIKRAMRKLEKEGYVISTSTHNKMKMDKSKWYRVNYSKCYSPTGQNAPSNGAECTDGEGQDASCDQGKMHLAITKEIKSTKKYKVENDLDTVSEIINYLNRQAGKSFKETSKTSRRFINARLSEGYTVDQFKAVIDVKVKQWSNDAYWNAYLRPSTLFSPKNFENYLNENQQSNKQTVRADQPRAPQLDFGKGEEQWESN
ncbi:conserved phage C-terminal domain-containing protein [Mammaliicoccus sciuri]